MIAARSLAVRAVDFIRLGRPLFLVGGFVLYGLGASAALMAVGRLDVTRLLWGQIAVTATQLMTHFCNDYFDLEADRANRTPTRWSGGSRVLPEGRLPARVALIAALILAAIALAAVLVIGLILRPGPLAAPIILTALLLSWSYSAPPLRLISRGLGETAVALIVPGLTPLVAFYMQTGRVSADLLWASAPLMLIQFAMLITIEFPDADGDSAVRKRTLVVRIGAANGARLYVLAIIGAYMIFAARVVADSLLPTTGLLGLLTLPLAGWQVWRVAHGAWRDPAQWDSLAFWTISVLMLMAVAEAVGFLVAANLSR